MSESVLQAVARALQLDEAESAHLFDLARAAQTMTPTRRRPTKQRVPTLPTPTTFIAQSTMVYRSNSMRSSSLSVSR